MADPLTLGVAATGASGGGSLISAFGALMGGASQSSMYGYQAGVSRLKQKIDLQNRDYAYATGETEASRFGIKARERAGAIKAGSGASGIDLGSGSKADLQTSQQKTTDIDMAQIRNNAARRAYGFSVEAASDEASANAYDRAAKDAKTAGFIKAAGSLVTGAASVSDKWLQGKSAGLWGNDDDENPFSSGGGGKPSPSGWV